LNLRKIIEIAATRGHNLKLKCIKFYFGWGSAPDPAARAYSVPPGPLPGFKGPTFKGRMGRKGKGGERGMKTGRVGEGEERGMGEGKGCVMAVGGDGRP